MILEILKLALLLAAIVAVISLSARLLLGKGRH